MSISPNHDAIVDAFEAEWKSNRQPDLPAFLRKVPESLQVDLAKLLIPIDIEYRINRGDNVTTSDYENIGSGFRSIAENAIESQFADLNGDTTQTLNRQDHSSKSRVIGNYKLLQKLGEGGMGTVWMAEQEKPVRRRVALKLIKAGHDSKEVVARFEAERQALAMMDHHNIAKVLDGGTTENGQPYFVMELVQGIPFNKYCDQHKLSINERLELFVPICNAVQHAHQKGIIHRDLKPSNILVSLYDGKPVPKVIDFGLAKALQHQSKLTDKTLFTEFGQVVGTLQYMSPEQAEMNQLDVDTRTDIYSLGVILYELLTGSTPIDADTLKNQAIFKVLESIREKEPPRPSVRLSSSTNEAVTGISQQRQIDPSKLKNILRGELDWIVMKALDKDRSRRYETASSLAEDVRRYATGEVVRARPPSKSYRTKKYIEKNRSLVAIAALLFLSLFGGFIGMGVLWVKTMHSRDLAEQKTSEANVAHEQSESRLKEAIAAKEEAEREREKANSEKRISAAVRLFLQDNVLRQASFWERGNNSWRSGLLEKPNSERIENEQKEITLREVVVKAAEEFSVDSIEAKFPGQPAVQAEILETLADTLMQIGRFDLGLTMADKASEIRDKALGLKSPESLACHIRMMFRNMMASRLPPAIMHFRNVVENLDELLTISQESETHDEKEAFNAAVIAVIDATENRLDLRRFVYPQFGSANVVTAIPALAGVLAVQPRLVRIYEQVMKEFPENSKEVMASHVIYGMVLHGVNRIGDATKHYEAAYQWLSQNLQAHDHRTAGIEIVLSIAYKRDPSKRSDSHRLRKKAYESLLITLGEQHPATSYALQGVLETYLDQDQGELAEEYLRSTLVQFEEKYGSSHRNAQHMRKNIAVLLVRLGKIEQAIETYRVIIRNAQNSSATNEVLTVECKHGLAKLLLDQGCNEEAETLLLSCEEVCDKVFGKDHVESQEIRLKLAQIEIQKGKSDEALIRLANAKEKARQVFGPYSRLYLDAIWLDQQALWNVDRRGEAIEQLEQLVQLEHRANSCSFDEADLLFQLSVRQRSMQSHQKARDALERCWKIRKKSMLGTPKEIDTESHLGECHLLNRRFDDAEPLLLNSWARLANLAKPPKTRRLVYARRLFSLYHASGNSESATLWSENIVNELKKSIGGGAVYEHEHEVDSNRITLGVYLAILGRIEEVGVIVSDVLTSGADNTLSHQENVKLNLLQFWLQVRANRSSNLSPDEVSCEIYEGENALSMFDCFEVAAVIDTLTEHLPDPSAEMWFNHASRLRDLAMDPTLPR